MADGQRIVNRELMPGRDEPRHHGGTHATHADEGNLFAHALPFLFSPAVFEFSSRLRQLRGLRSTRTALASPARAVG